VSLTRIVKLCVVIATCTAAGCGADQLPGPHRITWRFQLGDIVTYRIKMSFPGSGEGSNTAEVVEELEVLKVFENGDFWIGSKLREVNLKWRNGVWRSGGHKDSTENAPSVLMDIAQGLNGYNAIVVTEWGFVRGGKIYKSREEAVGNPKGGRGLGSDGLGVLPLDRLRLPRKEIRTGESWEEPPEPITVDADGPKISFGGKLMRIDSDTAELQCRMAVTKLSNSQDKKWDSIPARKVSAQVVWRNDVGVMSRCKLEESEVYPSSSFVKQLDVELHSMVRNGKPR